MSLLASTLLFIQLRAVEAACVLILAALFGAFSKQAKSYSKADNIILFALLGVFLVYVPSVYFATCLAWWFVLGDWMGASDPAWRNATMPLVHVGLIFCMNGFKVGGLFKPAGFGVAVLAALALICGVNYAAAVWLG